MRLFCDGKFSSLNCVADLSSRSAKWKERQWKSRGNLLPIHILKLHWGRYSAETCNERTLTTPLLVSFQESCLLKSAVEWSGAGGATCWANTLKFILQVV